MAAVYSTPDLLVVGRIIADTTETGLRVGGAASYAALTATKLGMRAAVVTNPHASLDLAAALPGSGLHFVGGPASTVFENVSTPSGRVQFWYGQGASILPSDIPQELRKVPLVLITPVAQDVHPAVAGVFTGSLVGLSPQGWLRRRDTSGRVSFRAWRGALQALRHAQVVVVSEEDLGEHHAGMQRLLARAPVCILTQGASGARLRSGGRWQHVPAFPAYEVDATGAGDVFATAFLCAYSQSKDPREAARFASCTASLSVEGEGFSALPTRTQVEARLADPLSVSP